MLTLSNKWRSIFVTYILLSTIILNTIEYYKPSIFLIYTNSQTRLIDFTVQIIIVTISMVMILRLFMNEFYKERNFVKILNRQLIESNEILHKISIMDELQDIVNRVNFDDHLFVSGGLIKYRGEKIEELLKGVDILLYKAKSNGRACIVKDID